LQENPDILRFYDYIVVDDLYILVMQYLKGSTLDQKMFRDYCSSSFKQTLWMIA